MAHLAYKFRLYPTAVQIRLLSQQLETLRRVYNDALQLRKDVYSVTKKSPSRGYLNRVAALSRNAQLDDAKHGRGGPKWLTQVAAVAIRDTCKRVEVAFDNFFRRVKAGQKPGFPRFKGYGRMRSIPFDNYASGCTIRDANGDTLRANVPLARSGYRLDLFGVGRIKAVAHRAIVGTIKTACVERDVDGKWYVVLVAESEAAAPEPSTNPPVGIDVGLESFLTTSDGEHRPNPRILKSQLKELRRLQRSSSRKVEAAKKRKVKFRECKNLQKSFRLTSKLHVRVRNLRKEHHHKESLRLVREYGVVCAEKLNVRGMVRNGKLSRAISDVAWGGFLIVLKHKAAKAGVRFVEVDARGTSQTCPQCQAVAKKKLKQRLHDCPCGYKVHRDHAAAQVILQRGMVGDGAGSVPVGANAVGMPREQSGGGRGCRRKSLAIDVVTTGLTGNRKLSRRGKVTSP